MFQIDAQSLPFVQTRSALLVLDLQNDFVGPDATLPVEKPPGYLDKVVGLVPDFRATGNVIWIRSCFQASRPVNEPYGESESVVTDIELNLAKRGDNNNLGKSGEHVPQPEDDLEKKETNGHAVESGALLALEEEDDPITETYLTVKPGKLPQVVLAMSPNTNLVQVVLNAMDATKDLIFQKTWYSAFRDGSLVQILRAKFVTEIFICGALTNISVFATAMDAARHGYAITIVEDCLGYRSKERHDEALRRLIEFTGCDVISSEVLAQELQEKAKKQPPPRTNQPRPGQKGTNSTLEQLMSSLSLKKDRSAGKQKASNSTGASPIVAAESAGSSQRAESNDSEDLQLPSKAAEPEKKRDRVRQKIRTRRRPSNPPKPAEREPGAAAPLSERGHVSTTATLEAATKALEDLPKTANETEDTPAKKEDIESPSREMKSEDPAMAKLTASMGAIAVHPDYVVEADQESSSEDGSSLLCEGDTTIIKNLLDDELADDIFEKIRDEVQWQKMSHQGGEVPRLVAVQGSVADDGSIPVYRHPADESPPLLPFSSTVSLIQKQVEKHLGHQVNHVLIQFYRNGSDYISEHSDKTLDIVPETFIANVSLGAQRTMVFRTKRQKGSEPATDVVAPRKAARAGLPHNSMCKMGLVTNMRWLHGIRQDKRLASEKMAEELAYQGGRISLTFRLIGTYLDKDQQKIWGQGAVAKTKEKAKAVINGNTPEAEMMLKAFGKENQSTEFDWKASYGDGFDVLHISNARKLFLSGDATADLRVKLYLAELNIEWTEGKLSPPFTWKDGSSHHGAPDIPESLPVKFVDNDLSKTTVTGDLAIMLYLDAVYGSKCNSPPKSQVDIGRQFTRLQQSVALQKRWRAQPFNVKPFQHELKSWEAYAREAPYIAGSTISVTDFAVFAIFEEIRNEWKNAEGVHNVVAWYFRIRYRESVMKVMGRLDEPARQRQAALASYPDVKKWDDDSE
ncbi:hypothetical protein ONS95_006040 [Cadophora gregata]|uniref:uncharacterized protein n=1 Tax=Cadophora gregata TaxID=51156 RepID=UPI0026DB3BC4|nr:uncharacterized protein ONS95_006040 [Cadophora gregata]KAK0102420.1 hypothetical protein ONS95_006040 [Cadophora gregata]KAK0104046.1 hypothetical protein ONS96_005149 [Cadophora gregata f. sp. sojae]